MNPHHSVFHHLAQSFALSDVQLLVGIVVISLVIIGGIGYACWQIAVPERGSDADRR